MKVEATEVRRQPEHPSGAGLLSEKSDRPRIGLVLSSGGAKGLAHIGVIQILEENDIHIDAAVGSSMGAYVAAVWAFGYDGGRMEFLARQMETPWSWLSLIDPLLWPHVGLLRGEKVRRRLKESIGDAQFNDLPRPLRVVATNLLTLERAVLASGEVALAVKASSAIPGVCAPVSIGDDLFLDGGVVDPLPVDVARELGMDIVIAVNVVPTPEHMRSRLNLAVRSRSHTFARAFRNWLRSNPVASPRSVFDVLHRTVLGAQMHIAEQSGRRADIVLRPLSIAGRWHDFHRAAEYIALGRQTALEQLPEIKRLLASHHTHETPASRHTLAVAA